MRIALLRILGLVLLSLFLASCKNSSSSSSHHGGGGGSGGTPNSDPGLTIYSVANQCFALRSVDGRYVREGGGYRADGDSIADAARFYFKPTSLGNYLLLSGYQREAKPASGWDAVEGADPGSKQLLGISDPGGEFLDELGNFTGEVDVLVSALGDIADFFLDATATGDEYSGDGSGPPAINADPLRQVGDGISGGGEQLAANDVSPALGMVSEASDLAVWTLSEPGDDRFALTSAVTARMLAAGPDGSLGLTEDGGEPLATEFLLEPVPGCDAYPEVSTNATLVDPRGPQIYWEGGDGDDVYGWVDDHAHVTAYEFIGGRINYGATHHKFGIDHALGDCEVNHGPHGSLGTVEMVTSSDAMQGHETAGWPSYNAWPRHNSLQHHQTYYKWLERSFLAGQKVLVNLVTHSEILCQLVPQKKNDCDGMANTRLQIQRTYELQDYIDAQSGGPGMGWFRVVTSPQQARQVIADGKMAVLLGIEMSKVLNCGEYLDQPECSREELVERLDEMEALGVRLIFPVHKFDNAFSGHLPHSGFALGPVLTAGNLAETGHPLEVEDCPEGDNFGGDANDPRNKPEGIFEFLLANFWYLVNQLPGSADTPFAEADPREGTNHLCNIRGLTDMGTFLLDELTARGMMIDVDHMSRRGAAAALDYLQAKGYPAISSHDWTGSDALMQRIAEGGGFIGRFANGNRDNWMGRLNGIAARYGANSEFMGGGMASDVNGIASLPGSPDTGGGETVLQYPFTSYDGRVRFDKQVTGDRVFGINDGRGVAHYGLYPDLIADAQQFGGEEAQKGLDVLFRSAEAYLRMWESAYGQRSR